MDAQTNRKQAATCAIPFSPRTRQALHETFEPTDRALATALLRAQFGFRGDADETEHVAERLRNAAIESSGGDIRRLRRAMVIGSVDWRQLLPPCTTIVYSTSAR